MVTGNQQRTRSGPATRQAARSQPPLSSTWLSDDQWLAWAWDRGLDLRDRDQLLDAASVGLSVLCWRNTSLENVHIGVRTLEQLDSERDPEVRAEQERAEQSYDEALFADWGVLAEADPDESARIDVLLLGRQQGFGIPDDIMMRLNISTALDVREVLDQTLPESVTVAGTQAPYDRRSVPAHVLALVDLLQDRRRKLVVGGSSITAGNVMADTWAEYAEDVIAKMSTHLAFCDLLGARRAVWYAALSGVLYAPAWFPNPWWTRAVELLRSAVLANRTIEVFPSLREASIPAPADRFWTSLLTNPARLNGRQCAWLRRNRLSELFLTVRDGDRQLLGPLPDDQRFPGVVAMF